MDVCAPPVRLIRGGARKSTPGTPVTCRGAEGESAREEEEAAEMEEDWRMRTFESSSALLSTLLSSSLLLDSVSEPPFTSSIG